MEVSINISIFVDGETEAQCHELTGQADIEHRTSESHSTTISASLSIEQGRRKIYCYWEFRLLTGFFPPQGLRPISLSEDKEKGIEETSYPCHLSSEMQDGKKAAGRARRMGCKPKKELKAAPPLLWITLSKSDTKSGNCLLLVSDPPPFSSSVSLTVLSRTQMLRKIKFSIFNSHKELGA